MTGSVPADVNDVRIRVTRGLSSWNFDVSRGHTDQVVLRVPGLLVIRAGRTIRSELASGPYQIACTFESVPCLPLVVDGPPGATIDLELIPENGQQLGLILTETFLAPPSFPTRLTVLPTTMWIMGGFGPFTLKAHPVVPPGT